MSTNNTHTPEQLLEMLNSGKTLSEIKGEVSASSEVTLSGISPQTSDGSCSPLPVKDEVTLCSPVDINLKSNRPRGGSEGVVPESVVTKTESNVAIRTNPRSIAPTGYVTPTVTEKIISPPPPSSPFFSQKEIVEIKPSRELPKCSDVVFDGVDVANPVELLLLLGEITLDVNNTNLPHLHDWQIRFMLDFADSRHTKESPFQAIAQACNSSGKDKYIIATCAVWICMRYKECYCPITSSSGDQLDKQTCTHLDRICNKVNAIFGKVWKLNYRHYEFLHEGDMGQPAPSVITCFATDEAGRAEGYHPVEQGRRMALFTSETKSIPSDITDALERCTGFTHRVDASSPGAATGYFYNTCMSALPREEIDDIKGLSSTQVILYKVTAYDCSHITPSEIERIASKLPGGKNNQVFRSSVMAEFGSTEEMVVIPSTFVWRAVEDLPKRKGEFGITHIPEPYNEAGLDLSDGGAETVLAVRNGNKLLAIEAFKFDDTEDTIDYLQKLFEKHSLNHKDALIRGDYCGLGGPMLRALKRKGWSNIRFVDSRNKAMEPKTYSNRGTELFFNTRELFQNKDLIIFYDKLLIDQLCTRYYKIRDGKIHQLLTKLEQKAKGFPSPDRADAFNLAFWNYKTNKKYQDEEVPFKEEEEDDRVPKPKLIADFDQREWANRHNNKYSADHVKQEDLDNLQEEIQQYNQRLTRN
jgi:hypothetical protein